MLGICLTIIDDHNPIQGLMYKKQIWDFHYIALLTQRKQDNISRQNKEPTGKTSQHPWIYLPTYLTLRWRWFSVCWRRENRRPVRTDLVSGSARRNRLEGQKSFRKWACQAFPTMDIRHTCDPLFKAKLLCYGMPFVGRRNLQSTKFGLDLLLWPCVVVSDGARIKLGKGA